MHKNAILKEFAKRKQMGWYFLRTSRDLPGLGIITTSAFPYICGNGHYRKDALYIPAKYSSATVGIAFGAFLAHRSLTYPCSSSTVTGSLETLVGQVQNELGLPLCGCFYVLSETGILLDAEIGRGIPNGG